MFQQIMVPLDGSARAERAQPCAERLARLAGATIHLVHSIEPPLDPSTMIWVPDMASVPPGLYDDLVALDARQATMYLDRVYAQVTAAGLRARAAPLTGHATAALLDYEREAGIDLVVMCSHGRSGLARVAFGSVADRLIHHGAAPVLLVRAFGDPLNLEHAVVPLDGSARAEEVLPLVEALAHDVLRQVTLLRVIHTLEQGPEADRYLATVAERLRGAHLVCYRRVMQGDPAAAIIAAAGAHRLVVMATHGRSGLTRWALGSVADRVLHGGAAGVLLARAGAVSRPRQVVSQARQQDEERQLVGSSGALS